MELPESFDAPWVASPDIQSHVLEAYPGRHLVFRVLELVRTVQVAASHV